MIYEDYNSINEFEVVMVKGEKGEKGDVGPAGRDGQDGANGTGSWGNLEGNIYSQNDLMRITEYATPTSVSVSGFTMPSGYYACGICWDGTNFYLNIYNITDSKIVTFDSNFNYIETKTIPDIRFGFHTISHKKKANGHTLLILSNSTTKNHNAYGFDYEDGTVSINENIRDGYLDGLSSNYNEIEDVIFFRNDIERTQANGKEHYITGMLTRRSNKLFIYSSDSYNYCNWGPGKPNPEDCYYTPFTVSDIPTEDSIISMCRHSTVHLGYADYTTIYALGLSTDVSITGGGKASISVFGLDGSLYKKLNLRNNYNYAGICYCSNNGSLYLSTRTGNIYEIKGIDSLYHKKSIYFKNPCYLYTKSESRTLSHNVYKETTHTGPKAHLLTSFYLNSLVLLDARGVRNLVNHSKGIFGTDGWFTSFETYNIDVVTRLDINLRWISSANNYENVLWLPFVPVEENVGGYLHLSLVENKAMGFYRSPNNGAITRITGLNNILANVFYGDYTNEIEYLISYPTIPEMLNNGELSTYAWN